eukprot:scaffold274318_cov55-Attheya_sp.AAC.1
MATPSYNNDSSILGITLASAFSSAGHTTRHMYPKNRVERSKRNHPCQTRVLPQGVILIMDDMAKRRKNTLSLCSLLEEEEESSSSKCSEELSLDVDEDVGGKVEAFTERKVMLVSLPSMTMDGRRSDDDESSSSSSESYNGEYDPSLLRRVWEWKDWALGDGRDYFIPRPKALRTLNSILVGQLLSTTTTTTNHNSNNTVHHEQEIANPATTTTTTITTTIDECGVLSNCARMDIVLVLNVTTTITVASSLGTEQSLVNSTQVMVVEQAVRHMVAHCVAQQLAVYESNHQQKQQAFFLDWPDHRVVEVVVEKTNSHDKTVISSPAADEDHTNDGVVQGLGNAWVVVEGLSEVVRHFCVVATGMAPRPSRPDRAVEFRPFSSRDAHILLQLKRSSESVVGISFLQKNGDDGKRRSSSPRISSLLFPAALTAGKAARDPQRVPPITALRGYAMESKRYFQRAPPALESLAIQVRTTFLSYYYRL